MVNHFQEYAEKLAQLLKDRAWTDVEHLAETLYVVWKDRRKVFLCGNGGSAGNAIHIANDFLYRIGQGSPPGLDVEALTAWSSLFDDTGMPGPDSPWLTS